ncbi:hypothetical protein GOP47_0011816 [Adiantum capillus-veneris]|uniref:Glutamine amidotransferase domain-containing protein n=1 Tax=Adiantum capillus-veneris TaxID=13818 RepID=A0A9D4UUT8_ADICA|nr:hypothetical protein GOP47_0011816 [Adiantum capillus-veneris]
MGLHVLTAAVEPTDCIQLLHTYNSMGLQVPTCSVDPTKHRKFAILLSGHASEYIRKTYGGVAVLIKNMLSDDGETWDTFHIVDGVFPSDEDLYKYEGFIITGSFEDSHGSKPWVLRLCEVVRKAYKMKKRLLGICFGHQVICRALGGRTGRATHGWELGVKNIQLADAMWLKSYAHQLPSSLNILEAHQDEVFELPPGGEVLASSKTTCVEIFAMGNQVLGVQGHPEFTEDIAFDILDTYAKKHGIPEGVVARAKLTLQVSKADSQILRRMCKSFIKATSCQMQTVDFSQMSIETAYAARKGFECYSLDSKLEHELRSAICRQ